ncbi:MAG TPA: hypothetical protein VFX16_23775 [Pseudonocardiaceae bacterium]|nr:hypothetical protein [Pseudonocardiaceae bacterium]
MTGVVRRLFGRLVDRQLPADFGGRLSPDENVLAVADLADGGHAVATSFGLWLPDGDGVRRIGWHLISKATWNQGSLAVIEADEIGSVADAVLLADRPARRLRLGQPGRLPQVVHARVTGSIKSRHHRDLPGGGAWFVQRSVAGRDGIVLQVRADPGTDQDAVRSLAAQVAEQVRKVRRTD